MAWEDNIAKGVEVLTLEELRPGATVRRVDARAVSVARELADRLYSICEREKRAEEGRSYNRLAQSWPDITRLAREDVMLVATQADIFTRVEE